MSRSRRTASNKSAPRRTHETNYGVEFVNIQLSADDVIALRGWDLSSEEMFLEIERWIDNGYKVSLSQDMDNTGGICAVTGKHGCVPEANDGKCLVSRGPDVRGAICATMYKLSAYCPDGEFPHAASAGSSDFG